MILTTKMAEYKKNNGVKVEELADFLHEFIYSCCIDSGKGRDCIVCMELAEQLDGEYLILKTTDSA